MMKATGLKRGSRKKQDAATTGKEEQHRKVTSSHKQQPHHSEPATNHPSRSNSKQRVPTDEVATLTTKNYRLAKELADLRVRHRDETKNVTRLTMENMNLASRCREAITHVAMLKKELAMQQKRTADALAAQREQTQRMADSLTSSMERSRLNRSSSSEESTEEHKCDIILRLMSATPSPPRSLNAGNESPVLSASSSTSSPKLSSNRPVSPLDEAREAPPTESPTAKRAVASHVSPKGEFFTDVEEKEEDDIVADTVLTSVVSFSPAADEDDDEDDGIEEEPSIIKTHKSEKDENLPVVYSTPKRSTDRWKPSFHDTDRADGVGLFPFSASPKSFSSSSNHNPASYNEEFPSDITEKPSWSRPHGSRFSRTPEVFDDLDDEQDDEGDLSGAGGAFSPSSVSSQQRKVNLISNIDAFEKSFTTDFPDSFTPKESLSTSDRKERKAEIYNPFMPTPERIRGSLRSPLLERKVVTDKGHGTPVARRKTGTEQSLDDLISEEKKVDEPSHEAASSSAETSNDDNIFETPPKGEKSSSSSLTIVEPGRPEKTMSSAARARYERALQPRQNNESLRPLNESNKNRKVVPMEETTTVAAEVLCPSTSGGENGISSTLLQRIQQKRMSKVVEQISPLPAEGYAHHTSSREESQPESSIIDVVDAFEGTMEEESPEVSPQTRKGSFEVDSSSKKDKIPNGVKQSVSARLLPIKSARRSVKQPVSYAEPALNTKLRRGDTYFTKSGSPVQQPIARNTPVVSPGDTAVH